MAQRTPGVANASALFALSQQMKNQQVPNQLNQEYALQLQRANAGNDYRYQQGLGELSGLRTRSMADVAGVGAQQAADINQQFSQRQASSNQDLSRRGLLGSSIVSSTNRTLGEGQAAAQNRLAEQMSLLRQGTDASTTGGLVNFIQNRTDQAPDMNSLMQLQQGLGGAGLSASGYPGSPSYGNSGYGQGSGSGYSGGNAGFPVPSFGNHPPSLMGGGYAGGNAGMPAGQGGNFNPALHGGTGIGGVFGTGYPTVNNGVVQDPWMTPVTGFNQGGVDPYAGRRRKADLSAQAPRNDPYTMLLRAMQDEGKSSSSRSAPMIRTSGDIENSPLDANGRMVSKPRNPAFYGTNAPAYQITMPGSFQGFKGTAPQLPGLNMGTRGYNYTPRAKHQQITQQTTPYVGGARPGYWQSSSGQWHKN